MRREREGGVPKFMISTWVKGLVNSYDLLFFNSMKHQLQTMELSISTLLYVCVSGVCERAKLCEFSSGLICLYSNNLYVGKTDLTLC